LGVVWNLQENTYCWVLTKTSKVITYFFECYQNGYSLAIKKIYVHCIFLTLLKIWPHLCFLGNQTPQESI
jgi:hypothetical protein